MRWWGSMGTCSIHNPHYSSLLTHITSSLRGLVVLWTWFFQRTGTSSSPILFYFKKNNNNKNPRFLTNIQITVEDWKTSFKEPGIKTTKPVTYLYYAQEEGSKKAKWTNYSSDIEREVKTCHFWLLSKQSCAPGREECNKYDLISHCCLFLIALIIMIGPGGLLLVVSHRFLVPVLLFMGGVAKKRN